MTENKWNLPSILLLTTIIGLVCWSIYLNVRWAANQQEALRTPIELRSIAAEITVGGCSHSGAENSEGYFAISETVNDATNGVTHEEELLPRDYILWKAGHPLAWSDFKAFPNGELDVDALSACGIVMTPKVISMRRLQFEVHCYFSPHDSWARDSRVSIELLDHEQAHFDLGEIYARVLRKRLQSAHLGRKNLDRQITRIYNEVFAEYHKMQKQYDRETEHSLDTQSQQQWENMIANSLRNSGKHARFVFEVPLH